MRFTSFVLGALTVLGFVALPAVAEPEAAPSIYSPAPEFDFGTQDNTGKVQHDFTVMNVGTATLVISDVKSSCGCTIAELKKKTLEPGEETTVSATFNLHDKQGPQTKVISVTSNDPKVPVYKLELRGVAEPAILVEPRFLNFGRVLGENAEPQTVQIKANKDDVNINIDRIEVSTDEWAAEKEVVTEGKEYKVTVKNVKPLAPGISQAVVTLFTDDADHPQIPIRIHAAVVGDLDVAPTQINLRWSEDGAPTQQYMRVGPGRITDFKILEVKTPIETMEAEIIPRGANNYNIRLGNMPTDTTLDGKELVIVTDLPENAEIKVPFQVIQPATIGKTLTPAAPAAPAAPATPAE
ncbi:MAG: DUF1573 domain-containing protein [Candidatus Hydrogenedens sp.]|nr:DUF1573 domain-containing protein [Candidatus Hydrogenedens sp.]